MFRFSRFAPALAIAAGAMFAGAARADLVTNGNFETGDFSGWTQFGSTALNGVACLGSASPTVAAGNCSAFFGPVAATGGISQTLATVAGASYDITFFFLPDGGSPSSFEFNWAGGASRLTLNSPAEASGYTRYDLRLVAPASSTAISFAFRDDPGTLFLDAVSINAAPVPEPTPLALALAGLGVVGAVVRRRLGRS